MRRPEFEIGARVRTVMGCRLSGTVVRAFAWRDSTDGTYKAPEHGDTVWVLWDDGTKGWMREHWVAREVAH